MTDLMPASSPFHPVEHRHLEALALRPADVHPQQHLGPVLRFGAAGAGMDGQHGVAAVVGALQHRLQFHPVERRLGGRQFDDEFVRRWRRRVRLRAAPPCPAASSMRVISPSTGAIHRLSVLNSCTCRRARSPSDQKAGSAWRASSSFRRADLRSRSKKVSKFDDPLLERRDAVGQIGHGGKIAARAA